MLLNSSESGHPVFRGTSALERGTSRSKGGGKLSKHLCGDPDTAELIFRTIISVNQLSIDGAVAGMCEDLVSRISDHLVSTGKLVAEDKPETMVSPTDLSTTTNPLLNSDRARETCVREYKQRFTNLPDDLRMVKVCSDAGFMKTVVRGQYFVTMDEAELTKLDCPGSCREYTLLRDDNLSQAKVETRRLALLEVAVSYHQDRYGIETRINSLLGDGSQSWVMMCTGLNKWRKCSVLQKKTRKTRTPRRRKWSTRGKTWCFSKTEANIIADVIFSES